MAQKRPFDDEVVNEVSSKHPRQDGPSDEMVSRDDHVSVEGTPGITYNSGEASLGKNGIEFQEFENGSCPESFGKAVEDIETDVPRSIILPQWTASGSIDDDVHPAERVLPFLPGYFSFDTPVRSAVNLDDVCYCSLDYPPRKRVPVGPQHQAEIPRWSAHGDVNASCGLEKSEPGASDRDPLSLGNGHLGGICIIPSLVNEPPQYNGQKAGDARIDCSCLDQGSVRCVQQHIAEARDKLRITLGQDTFIELGFNDMGEIVAEKWSEEEEQLFFKVVHTNAASLGKNFWNALSTVFPFRTKMEIVSYYFNVFMLRKRAEQNRYDPRNIDSDDDEWLGSDDDGGDEDGLSDEDEASGVESPARHVSLEFHQNALPGYEDENDDDGDLSDEAGESRGKKNEGFVQISNPNSVIECLSKKSDDDVGENDVQDGSCTSSDSGAPVQGRQLNADDFHDWHEHMFGSSHPKTWDGYNMSCPKSNEDFLPTCSMIEEVFGDADFESKSRRW